MLPFSDYLKASRPCQHEEWDGCPEVDATCKKCGMDEFEVNKEQEDMHASWWLLANIENDVAAALDKGIKAMQTQIN